MKPHQVLITGANRGLGLEFTKQYAADGWNVLACCRHPQSALDLQALAKVNANISIQALDVADFAQINALALQLKDEAIDVLINNAGVYPASSFGDTNYQAWAEGFKVNGMMKTTPFNHSSPLAITSHFGVGIILATTPPSRITVSLPRMWLFQGVLRLGNSASLA